MGPYPPTVARPVPLGKTVEKSEMFPRKGGAAGRGVHGRGAVSSAAAQTLDRRGERFFAPTPVRRVSGLFVRGGRTNCRGDACVAPTTPECLREETSGRCNAAFPPPTRGAGGVRISAWKFRVDAIRRRGPSPQDHVRGRLQPSPALRQAQGPEGGGNSLGTRASRPHPPPEGRRFALEIIYKTIPKAVFPRHTPSSSRPVRPLYIPAPFVIPAQAGIQRTPFP